MLLAILGRGSQEVAGSGWDVTEDLEVCGPTGAHLAVRVPADDQNPYCRVGGGELNLLAGAELHRKLGAALVVCGYGHRLPYLLECNGPSDSEVMSERFYAILNAECMSLPEVRVWHRDRVVPGNSNTQRELQNIFEFALERGIQRVAVVTVAVHLPRTILFARDHRHKNHAFRTLEISFHVSEQVLVEADPQRYIGRVLALQSSQSYIRTAFFERRGSQAFIEGRY